ncbi:MAG: PaaX family transcriptional regulator [Candidatus Dormibacteraeota bacterium]|nr:PaaX family transcriptional regulator [Candidatus Dormibacteraeota bacterium]
MVRRSPLAAQTLEAAPPDLRHLAAVLEESTPAERRAAQARSLRRGLTHPSARSLLFTVLGEYVLPSGGEAWSSELIAALRAMDVDERAARQAIARTGAAGWLTSRRSGRRVSWRLTDLARDLLERGAERIYHFGATQAAWNGQWLLLRINVPEERRELRQKLRTQLAWASFGPLRQSLWISPHTTREQEAVRVIENLGLARDATSLVVRVGAVGDDAALAREAWDLPALAVEYESFLDDFESAPSLTAETTFAALTRMVHEWRRFPFIDPALPAPLLPRNWIGHRARRLFVRRRATWGPTASRWFHSHSTHALDAPGLSTKKRGLH